MLVGSDYLDFVGWKMIFLLVYLEYDICDFFIVQNLYGLGFGVYLLCEKLFWLVYLNMLIFIEIKFKDEVMDVDWVGQEILIQVLECLIEVQQWGVLGFGKFEVFKVGKFIQGMICVFWWVVQQCIGDVMGLEFIVIVKVLECVNVLVFDLDLIFCFGLVKVEEFL